MEKEKDESESSVCTEARESDVQRTGAGRADGGKGEESKCPPDEKWIIHMC